MDNKQKELMVKAVTHLEGLKVSDIDMGMYRSGDLTTHECGSVGCILGHVTVLVGEEDLPWFEGEIDFDTLSEVMFGIPYDSTDWDFLFDDDYCLAEVVVENQLIDAINRMKYYLHHGKPPLTTCKRFSVFGLAEWNKEAINWVDNTTKESK